MHHFPGFVYLSVFSYRSLIELCKDNYFDLFWSRNSYISFYLGLVSGNLFCSFESAMFPCFSVCCDFFVPEVYASVPAATSPSIMDWLRKEEDLR